jgi:hypothetical protein
MPQSVDTTTFSGAMNGQRTTMRAATVSGCSTF